MLTLSAAIAVLLTAVMGGAIVPAWAQAEDGSESRSIAVGDLESGNEPADDGAELSRGSSGEKPAADGRDEPEPSQTAQVDGGLSASSAGAVAAESDPNGAITSYSLFRLFDASGRWASPESRSSAVQALTALDPGYEDLRESPQSEYAAREAFGSYDPSEVAAALARAFSDESAQVVVPVRETVAVEAGSYVAVPNAGAGYALIEVSEGETKRLFAKNSLPSLDKEISRDGVSFGSAVTAGAGDELVYRLVVGLPSDVSAHSPYRLTIADAPCAGVDIDEGSIGVSAGGEEISEDAFETVWNEDARVLSIRFDDVSPLGKEPGESLVVEYRARMNDQAVMGGEGNRNTAKVITDYGETPSQPAVAYTFGLVVEKKAADSDLLLPNAGFQLLDEKGRVRAEGMTDQDGRVSFSRIDAGTYALRESAAPQGYRTAEDVPVVLEASEEDGVLRLEARAASGGIVSVDAERGIATVSVRNSPVMAALSAPQTGDLLRLSVFAALAAGAAVAALIAASRKQTR